MDTPLPITVGHPVVGGILRELASRRGSDALGELARELVAGRLTVRAAAMGNAYAGPLGEAMDRVVHHVSSLGPTERAALNEQVRDLGERVCQHVEHEVPPEPPARSRTRHDHDDDDDWNERSVMVPARRN